MKKYVFKNRFNYVDVIGVGCLIQGLHNLDISFFVLAGILLIVSSFNS